MNAIIAMKAHVQRRDAVPHMKLLVARELNTKVVGDWPHARGTAAPRERSDGSAPPSAAGSGERVNGQAAA